MSKLGIIFMVCSLLMGCAAKHKEVFKEEVMETSKDSSKPEWVFKTFKEVDDGYEFSGGVSDVADYALGTSEARAEAIKNGMVSIQIKVGTEFTKFAEGSNMSQDLIGKWVSDGIAFLSDSLYVSGIKQKGIYYEKVISNIEYKPHYNIWALLAIT